MSETIRRVVFAPNIPQQLALADVDAMLESHAWGEQWFYQVSDGRVLYVCDELAQKVNMLDLRAGEPFVVCKRWNGQRSQPVRWDVWRAGESEKARAEEERPEIEEQLRQSIDLVRSRKNGTGAPKDARTVNLPQGFKPQPNSTSTPRVERKQAAVAELSAPEQPAMLHFPWCSFLLSQSEALIDVMAAAVDYAGKRYGATVKADDVRALVITGYINMRGRNAEGSNVA